MAKLIEQSCRDFSAALASKSSVPGGGGASALVGALGIALCSMAGNLTVGKKKYASVESDLQELLQKAENLRMQFLSLVDKDAELFAPLAKAYRIPKDDPTRDDSLEAATLIACQAPREMVSLCCQAIDLLDEMLTKGSQMMISDVGCGALFCKAALESAALNVFINTKTLHDRVKAKAIESEIDNMLQIYTAKAQSIVEKVMRSIR